MTKCHFGVSCFFIDVNNKTVSHMAQFLCQEIFATKMHKYL